jgi:hypothetical protein
MIAQALDPVDPTEIETISRELELADYVQIVRRTLLARLLFSPRHGHVSEWFADFSDRLEPYVRIEWLLLVWFFGAALFSVQTASVPLTFGSLLFAFFTWRKNQRDRNVDDAMRRKDRANQLIIEHTRVVFPYVGNVFERLAHSWNGIPSFEDEVTAEMFVFSKIDNLEYVFDKCRSGLIEPKYTIRAIKVFVARADNPRFEQLARRLVRAGKYNHEFVNCVDKLLCVGLLSRRSARRSEMPSA